MKRPLHIMIKRYASLVLAATMTFVLAASPSVFATESEDELNSVQEQQNDAKESLEEIKTNITKYENQLSELDTQQTEIQTQINAKVPGRHRARFRRPRAARRRAVICRPCEPHAIWLQRSMTLKPNG